MKFGLIYHMFFPEEALDGYGVDLLQGDQVIPCGFCVADRKQIEDMVAESDKGEGGQCAGMATGEEKGQEGNCAGMGSGDDKDKAEGKCAGKDKSDNKGGEGKCGEGKCAGA